EKKEAGLFWVEGEVLDVKRMSIEGLLLKKEVRVGMKETEIEEKEWTWLNIMLVKCWRWGKGKQ
uniref:hypothetical protein n=1 Tax=Bacillus pumilus TaxID=1408 RepID=UPI001642D546